MQQPVFTTNGDATMSDVPPMCGGLGGVVGGIGWGGGGVGGGGSSHGLLANTAPSNEDATMSNLPPTESQEPSIESDTLGSGGGGSSGGGGGNSGGGGNKGGVGEGGKDQWTLSSEHLAEVLSAAFPTMDRTITFVKQAKQRDDAFKSVHYQVNMVRLSREELCLKMAECRPEGLTTAEDLFAWLVSAVVCGVYACNSSVTLGCYCLLLSAR